MRNKEQIMINGVDVSECEYLTYQLEEDGQYYWFCKISPTGGPDECEYNPKCFYKRVLKQLARKTQECEELKGRLEYIHQENKNLKNSVTAEQIDYVSLKNYISTLEFAENRYRKALKEIEAACRADTHTFADGTQVHYDSLDDILDIINKVKEG